jgi:hypothetical protein
LISSALVYSPLDHVDEHVPVPGRVALNDNLQTLLSMFNEGLSRPSLAREEA